MSAEGRREQEQRRPPHQASERENSTAESDKQQDRKKGIAAAWIGRTGLPGASAWKLRADTSAVSPMQQIGVEPAGPRPAKSQIVTWLPPLVAR